MFLRNEFLNFDLRFPIFGTQSVLAGRACSPSAPLAGKEPCPTIGRLGEPSLPRLSQTHKSAITNQQSKMSSGGAV